MPNPSPNHPLRTLLVGLVGRIEHAANSVNRIELSLLDARNELDDLTAALQRVLSNPKVMDLLGGDLVRILAEAQSEGEITGHHSLLLDQALRDEARNGAEQITFEKQDDGSVRVLVDARRIELTDKLAELLRLLAADENASKDHLVAWKEREEVREALGRNLGEYPMESGVFNNLLHRLKLKLEQGGLHGEFLQRNRKLRLVRFALRTRHPGLE